MVQGFKPFLVSEKVDASKRHTRLRTVHFGCSVLSHITKMPSVVSHARGVWEATKILGAKEALTTRSTPRVRFLALSDSDRSKLFSIFFFHYKVRGVLGNTVATKLVLHNGDLESGNIAVMGDISLVEAVTSPTQGLICIEEDNQNRNMNKTSKRKNPTKKRKVNSEQEVMTVGPQDSLQQMDKISSRAVTLDGYYGTPQSVQGMVQLNLMAPTRDNYYGNQQTIQGLGQLNSIAPSHDGYYSTQQGMHGLGQMDFFRTPAGFTYNIRDDPNVRTAQLHDDASRHPPNFPISPTRLFPTRDLEVALSHNLADDLLDDRDNMHGGNGVSENMIDIVDEVHGRDGGNLAEGLREAEEINIGSLARSSKKKNTIRKRKVQSKPDVLLVEAHDSLQQMENLTSDGMTLNGFYGAQQNVQGLVPLNLMEPPHDGYYVNPQSMQGLGQLNSIAPSHDGFFGTQQNMHGLGQLDFRPSSSFNYSLQDESHLRSAHLHGSASRHP
ncbi:hypothetical protein QYF36_014914 [Acer negundo]|nr:hypothetical protein QYF36_014914 [Acer negundo]